MIRHRRSWPELSEALPVDVLPRSNGEYIPPPPTARQLAVMRLADAETERWRRRFGMDRRQFVRTTAAMAIGFWALDALGDRRFGSYARLDSETVGFPFLQRVVDVSRAYGVPPVVAAHKGFALAGFDQRAASPRDVGPAAKAFPDVRFLVYHSGHDVDEGPQRPYAGDDKVPDDARTVDALIKSLRRHGLDGPANGGNSPNVWAELGSVWRDYMHDPASAAHLLGKLITHVGPRRVVWGTDSLWYGSPQAEIVALRRFDFSEEGKALYGLPYGLEGDALDPRRPAPVPWRTIRNAIFGRNAAEAYGVDPDARRKALSCDAVNELRHGYGTSVGSAGTIRPQASLVAPGPRTRRELFSLLRSRPFGP